LPVAGFIVESAPAIDSGCWLYYYALKWRSGTFRVDPLTARNTQLVVGKLVTYWRTLKWSSARRAFTLMELAIVLGIAGIVLGAVWTYAANAYHNYNVSKAIQGVATITDNVRNNFMGMPKGNSASPTEMLISVNDAECNNVAFKNCTKSLDALGLIPADMRRNPSAAPGTSQIDHPMDHTTTAPSGSLGVYVTNTYGNPIIAYYLHSLTQEYCIKLLMQLPIAEFTYLAITSSTFSSTGFVCYIYNGVPDYSGAYGVPCSVASGLIPMQISVAQQWCADTGPTNDISFTLKLH
jgi:prepilin-type N-terminal cleavage/methylation domain-containing protein